MNITFNIPDDVAGDIVDGICTVTGYNVESGLTKGQWAKQKLIEHMKRMAVMGKQRELAAATQSAINASNIT